MTFFIKHIYLNYIESIKDKDPLILKEIMPFILMT